MSKTPALRAPDNDAIKKRAVRPAVNRRAHSTGPVSSELRPRSPAFGKKITERRCQSLSPSATRTTKKSFERVRLTQASTSSAPDSLSLCSQNNQNTNNSSQRSSKTDFTDKDPVLPHCVIVKMTRALATKKREFMKMRKNLITQQSLSHLISVEELQQMLNGLASASRRIGLGMNLDKTKVMNTLIETYASLKELEARSGVKPCDNSMGEIRVLSVTTWPAHDLLLLIRDDLDLPINSEISGVFGPQILQQLHAQLNTIPEDVCGMGAEIMARRIDLLNLLRGKYRSDRSSYMTNMEWKTKNSEFDAETEQLHRMVAGIAENLKAKLNFTMELAKVPWIDRETLIKKTERLQKEIVLLQNKYEEVKKDVKEDSKDTTSLQDSPPPVPYQTLCEELSKEKSAREALKDVVSAAESMLRVARARIATLERQLKDTKTELDAAKKKHKDLELLYRHRESSYDARSKKLLEVSKTGEVTIEGLLRQRDALELRVKELREQAEAVERTNASREMEQRARVESLQAKVAEQEKHKRSSDMRVGELEGKVKELEDTLQALRERSVRLVDMERRRCLEYVPSKENEPSDRETEIWKELQVTKVALSRAEEEVRQCKADKDSFLCSLSRIAQGEDGQGFKEKMATELLEREQKIMKLQHAIEDHCENEKIMEQSMTQYENQLASLRLEVKRLRNYDCYSKDVPYQHLQTELLELHMQVETLSRERTALVTAAASRALMLERHERAADLFARMTVARRDLTAIIDGRSEPAQLDEGAHAEISRSLSSVCASAADTWTALRAERARVLRLESAVLAQSVQLERENRVRTQLERRRAYLERELLRMQHSAAFPGHSVMSKNPSLIQDFFRHR